MNETRLGTLFSGDAKNPPFFNSRTIVEAEQKMTSVSYPTPSQPTDLKAGLHDAYAAAYEAQVQTYDCHLAEVLFGLATLRGERCLSRVRENKLPERFCKGRG